MKQVFASSAAHEAYLVASVLADHDVPAIVQGEMLSAAAGELPLLGLAGPGVWVLHDEDAARAAEIIRTRYVPPAPAQCPHCGRRQRDTDEPRCSGCGATLRAPRVTWECSNCGERVERQFAECWKCGAARGAAREQRDE